MSWLPAEVRAALRAAKRAAPIPTGDKVARVDLSGLPGAPPAPKPREPGKRTRINPINRERRAAAKMVTHGKHADWVAALPCCACFPEHYTGAGWSGHECPTCGTWNPLTAYRCAQCHGERAALKPFLLDRDPDAPEQRISDPHHFETVGAGGKKQRCVPLCPHHHKQLDSPGWGQQTFQATYGLDFNRIARLLWDNSPYREEGA